MGRIWDLGSLDIEAFEMVCVWFEVFDFAIDEGWELGVKGRVLDLKDGFFEFIMGSWGDALEGDFFGVGGVIFGVDVF